MTLSLIKIQVKVLQCKYFTKKKKRIWRSIWKPIRVWDHHAYCVLFNQGISMADNYALLKLGVSWTALKVMLESRVKFANQIKESCIILFDKKH